MRHHIGVPNLKRNLLHERTLAGHSIAQQTHQFSYSFLYLTSAFPCRSCYVCFVMRRIDTSYGLSMDWYSILNTHCLHEKDAVILNNRYRTISWPRNIIEPIYSGQCHHIRELYRKRLCFLSGNQYKNPKNFYLCSSNLFEID